MGLNSKKVSDLRITNLRYAIASSLASKVATAAVQIIALPMAAVSLGSHGFALYAILTAAVGWLTLSNLGIGPTLVVRLATAHVNRNLEDERTIFSSAFFAVFVISICVSITALLAIWLLPINHIFGPLYIKDVTTIRWGLTVLVTLFLLQTNLSLFESAQAGYQEQYVQNMIATVSGIPCILAVIFVAKNNPTPVGLILALNLPLIIFRFGNAIWIIRRHKQILPDIASFRWPICKQLVQNGAIFSLAGGAGNFLAHILPIILIGRSFDSAISASFAAMMQAIILLSGVIAMLATPLWPAIADSVARGDRKWAKKAYDRLLCSVMGFGLLTSIFLVVKGDLLFYYWFNAKINPSENLLIAAAIYFLLLCWESAHFTILVGLQKIAMASLLICGRAVLGIFSTIIFLKTGDESMPFICMFISIILLNFIPMRIIVMNKLRS